MGNALANLSGVGAPPGRDRSAPTTDTDSDEDISHQRFITPSAQTADGRNVIIGAQRGARAARLHRQQECRVNHSSKTTDSHPSTWLLEQTQELASALEDIVDRQPAAAPSLFANMSRFYTPARDLLQSILQDSPPSGDYNRPSTWFLERTR